MKRFFISIFILCIFFPVVAQTPKEFQFTTLKEIPITPVKNQASSGTCWSFSGLGLIEAELVRQGKGEHDLSEMFIVYKNYGDKAQKYVRTNGTINFAAGGSFADVLDAIRDYGIVPDEIQPGLNYGEEKHKHAELDQLTKAYVDVIVKNPNKKLSTAWYKGYTGILNAYLGEAPASFTYNGKQYTPQSYAQSLGINANDYVSLTSFTHHPFYTAFPIEIPDNWRWSASYNLPLNELMQVIDNAIDKGYTVAWASDVSEKGFNRKGLAVVPDVNAAEAPGSDQAHWLGLDQKAREAFLDALSSPVPEKKITQEIRQQGFDNYETTDDHGMLIYGTAQDQNGTKYYMVKNSWGTDSPYKGAWYASVPFVEYKTISIVLHKDVIPSGLRKKLGI
ncbi:aminopeptidase [Bacteroidia bacterium]|nr:aminopeptidase [Bacteroidia bacterium]GHT05119.1 aminopeptidase [Bacteroidia bacterium]